MTPLLRPRSCFVLFTTAESSSSGLATKGVSSIGKRVKQAHRLRKCFDHIICLCFYFNAFASAPGRVSLSIFFPGVFYMHVAFAMGRTLWVWFGWSLDIHCMRGGCFGLGISALVPPCSSCLLCSCCYSWDMTGSALSDHISPI